ncbi:MAG TPA: sigma-70 family RNA polymerase sigma factor [Anaeromyxobacteraceae bacterium]|nr:sigma-70 family RNA polymerase sigma factor [Anaeromyxobacteraceae bacterium]
MEPLGHTRIPAPARVRAPGPELRVIDGRDAGGSPGAERSDEELLRDFQSGDERAFEELVRRHERRVRAVVRRYAQRPEDVLDLAQRAFLRALQAARRARWLPLGQPPFQALLLRTAVNLGKNHARDAARWRRAPVEALESLEVAPDGSERLEHEERARRMRDLVSRLPRRQREVLTLRIDAELSFAEIAESLSITENNAKVHFHHATRRLAALLAGSPEDEP